MSIVSCPRCRDEVTVPTKARPSALVRCPLCREQYRLEEALDQLPPALIVLEGGYDDDEGELVGAGVSEYQVAGEYGGSSGFDRGDGMSDRVFSTGGPGGTALADSAVAAPTPRLTGAPRPKRKEKSAVAEIIKVVLGGVVGLTAGMLILWWAFGRDPLQLGPTVSQYAPWIVPTQFHGKGAPVVQQPKTTADTSGAGGTPIAANPGGPQQRPPTTTPGGAGNGFGPPGGDLNSEVNSFDPMNPGAPKTDTTQFPAADPPGGLGGIEPGADPAGLTIDPTLPGLDGDDPEMAAPGNPLNSLDSDTLPNLGPATDTPETTSPLENAEPGAFDPAAPPVPENTTPAPPATDSAGTTPTAPDPFADLTTPAPGTTPPVPGSDPAEAPMVQAAEVDEAVAATTAAREAFENSKGQAAEVRRQLATDMYASASKLGQILAQASTGDADFAATMEKANAELAALAEPTKRSMLARLAAMRLDAPEEEPGVVLVGTVKDFKSVGSMYETTLEMAGKEPRVVFVVSSDNPQDTFKVGDQAAIVGRIIRDVKAELPRYGGEQTLLVEQGHAIALSAQ